MSRPGIEQTMKAYKMRNNFVCRTVQQQGWMNNEHRETSATLTTRCGITTSKSPTQNQNDPNSDLDVTKDRFDQ